MRHSRAHNRALSHCSGGAIRRPLATPPPRDDHRSGPSALEPVLLSAAALFAALAAVVLLTGIGEPQGLLLMSALLAGADVLAQRPRLADRVIATVLGLVLLPALILVALAVRLSGPGPVVVRQTAPGPGGRARPRLRFRTTDAAGDRPTAIGRLLRHFSLDLLPSLFDVVRGQRTLLQVGSH